MKLDLLANKIDKNKKARQSQYKKRNSLAFAINQVKDLLDNQDLKNIQVVNDEQTTENIEITNEQIHQNVNDSLVNVVSLKYNSDCTKNSSFIDTIDIDNPDLSSTNFNLSKYWVQRYHLFSKFDEGIKMDEESWFSVCHEKIANHITSRSQDDIFIDVCCGVGSTCIQAANHFLFVFGVDIDPIKLEAAKINAEIYNVANYIDFIQADFRILFERGFRRPFIDVIYVDVPWGGPNYLANTSIDCCDPNFSIINLPNAYHLCKTHQKSKQIMFSLPRNTSLKSIGQLFRNEPFEIEKNYLKNAFKRITVYTGDLINDPNDKKYVNNIPNEELKNPPKTVYKNVKEPSKDIKFDDNERENEYYDICQYETDDVFSVINSSKSTKNSINKRKLPELNQEDPFSKELLDLQNLMKPSNIKKLI
ncbi:unnamed protein product [Gordionus sp. m RMFG-2023]|uniref:trimethylguanosine synthase-like n=1 Tax=Gordionus sp. m RMFG-2023 TaxID=3053472 RepID=UPI0030E384FB